MEAVYASGCKKAEKGRTKSYSNQRTRSCSVYNPALVYDGKVQPEKGKAYLDRKVQHEGMVTDEVVQLFAKYGWKWGGYYSPKNIDYMHFEKDIDENYSCNSMILRSKQ